MAQKILVNTVQVGTTEHVAGSSYDSVREAQLIVAIEGAGGRFADPTPEVLAAAAIALELHKKGQTPEELDGVMISNVTSDAVNMAYDDSALPHTGATTVQAAIDYVKSHGTPLSDATPTNLGTAAPGNSTSASRANHVHGHGNLAGGSLHADVIAGGASGFMPGTDKTKLDSMVAPTPVQDIFYIGPLGSDTTGDGTEAKPFATLQKAYDTWFPSGTPLTWPEFDRKRVFRILPGTTAAGAGNLAASCCNFVIEGFGTIGSVTYDVKSEVMAMFTGASANYESNTIHFRSGGFGWNTSSADAQLITGDVTISNFNVAPPREVQVTFESCQVQVKTQCRSGIPGGSSGAIYIRAIDSILIYCESGVNALGNAPMTFSILRDCVFRNQVNATKGAIGFADMQGCYFRRGFIGDPGIASMVSTGVFRGWEVNHLKYAFDVSAYPQELRMDYPTWKYIKEEASPVLGTCTVKLTDQFGGVTGSRPTGVLPAGMCYFDTTLGRPVWWSGAAWLGADGLAA